MSSAPLTLPDGFTGRPLTADDAPAAAALLAAAEPLDDTGEHHSAADLLEFWVNELVHLADDGRAVLDADGTLVGYATTIAPPTFRDAYGVHLEGRVHPDRRRRGIGRALLDWQLARGAELHAERHPEAPARLTVTAHTTMPSLEALLRTAGLEQLRWYHHMHRDLAELPPARTVEGVRLTSFTWDRDEQLRHAHNAAFTEHYGSSERDVASWQVMFTGQRSFRPDLTVLALDGEEVVGYVIAYVYESDTAATGREEVYYGQIGVVPVARGRGLAKAVIIEALRTAAAAGCAGAGLEVDNDNVTDALGLYESLGFATARTVVSCSRRIPPLR
ncbi:GNAT family N-acetyltransferase [Modestobacter sp. I12A-02628]|uniref:GNAT family N-acetyltransferase n=1 Tax=Goekera deserti TaxID=2497753 RepID=A0A7K3WC36_9ACTN|nr:GNAT family N-acetyltransferase [Goekera deserti]MPQ98453.1 GNAT family N-acetyltransferase [Goekera deserti]NDI48282.1 GNAT family N-acetyltransferase [Goekera deserti]NEL54031.1 GNAT family N-acetyltransferase [Goekera deserti]